MIEYSCYGISLNIYHSFNKKYQILSIYIKSLYLFIILKLFEKKVFVSLKNARLIEPTRKQTQMECRNQGKLIIN